MSGEGPQAMRRWEERGWGDSRKEAQRSRGPTALGSTAGDSSGFQVWGSAWPLSSPPMRLAPQRTATLEVWDSRLQACPCAVPRGVSTNLSPELFCHEQ